MSDPNRHPHSQNPRPSSPPQRPSLAEAIGLSGGGHSGRNDSPSKSLEALGFVMDVPVELTVEIGRKNVKIADVLRLGPGSVAPRVRLPSWATKRKSSSFDDLRPQPTHVRTATPCLRRGLVAPLLGAHLGGHLFFLGFRRRRNLSRLR